MTNLATWLGKAAAAFSAAVALMATAACSSNHGPSHPPFPTEVDPCAAYCLVWVEPVYVDVPRVVQTHCGGVAQEKVPVRRTTFQEVCTCGHYEPRCTPVRRTTEEQVQVSPAHDEWKNVKCPCEKDCCCWKRERVPAQYKTCEKTYTEGGIEYCAFTPPTYDVVAHTETTCENRCHYVPAEYGVVYEQQLYAPGHWEWKKKYDCKEKCDPCPPKRVKKAVRSCDCRGIPAAD